MILPPLLQPPAGYEWRLFACTSCAVDDDGLRQDDERVFRFVAPIKVDAHEDASGPIEWCPFCEEYLSFMSYGAVKLEDVKTPTEGAR